MALDPSEFIADLSPSDPPGTDPASQADDHLRATKKSIAQTFPGAFDAPLTLSPTDIEALEGRIAALEALPLAARGAPVGGVGIMTDTVNPTVITGVGFQPSAIMIMTVRVATGPTNSISIGMATPTFQGCISTGVSRNNDLEFGQRIAAQIYSVGRYDINGAPVLASGLIDSFDLDGFTVGKVVNTEAITFFWQAFA